MRWASLRAHRALGHASPIARFPPRVDDGHRVLVAAHGPGHADIVGDDPVAGLPCQLCLGVGLHMIGLGGETHHQAGPARMFRQGRQNVFSGFSVEWDTLGLARALSIFCPPWPQRLRPPVGDGGDEHRDVGGQGGLAGAQHLAGAFDIHTGDAGGRAASAVGPETSVTFAAEASARRRWRNSACPDERLVSTRTGSQAPRRSVPAVTIARVPARVRGPRQEAIQDRLEDRGGLRPSGPGRIRRRPWPSSSGPTKRTPSAPRSTARFRWVAGCSHMRTFMAGAPSAPACRWPAGSSTPGRRPGRWPPWPSGRSAVAGATTTRSADRESSMWPISDSSVSEKRSAYTRSSARADRDSGVMNSAPAAVSRGRTPKPAFRSSLVSSRAL